ncbi:MAG: leucine--tRNA ligase [Patescibacteria group bacterium]|mgnify:CR=1 FL=1
MKKYIPSAVEPKWQKKWEEDGMYKAYDFDKRKKFYCLIEFPYPSGAGLHVGHVRSWSAMDAYSRKKRMEGYNVLYPIGWDAFGLPAENYAISLGVHPSEIVPKNIAKFKTQCKAIGLSFDWSREIDTTDPKYYKWTQWIFLKFFEKSLAYQADVPVNWCPSCKTNLADEEVLADGTHERCGIMTEKRMQKQWLLRITQYADKLLEDLKTVDYPKMVAEQQINWIGRKEGINITYKVKDSKEEVVCFTTRPDTNFGATFIVLGPEHPIILKLTKDKYLEEVKKYIKKTTSKSEIERIAEGRKKTGVFTGSYAINNLNNKLMPIWISDFVLGHVGTGAVVGVPGHDKRDFEFAKEFGLEIIRVVVGKDGDTSAITRIEQVQEEEGKMINSEFLDDLDIREATKKVMDYLEKKGFGKRVVSYHLRDWVFSRQHYWGEPIPIIHCSKCGLVPVPEKDLPVELPYLKKYEPSGTGQSPLANAKEWVNVPCPKCGGKAKRETDTMPNWAGSNWYFLRYLDPLNDKEIAGEEKMAYWMPVDIYQGGFEHTTLHLLYSRFVYKFLYDIGVAPTSEPYAKRRPHGIVLGPDGRKMSKSFGNVINPDDIINQYGADTLRIYEMFMGPFDQINVWNEDGVNGVYHFLQRVWLLYDKLDPIKTSLSREDLMIMHKTIKKVSGDIENIKFNTAVASMMEWLNYLSRKEKVSKEEYKTFLLLLAPFAPHITEELWESIGEKYSIHQPRLNRGQQSWPKFDKKYLEEEEVSVVVQINGKVRDILVIEKDILNNKEVIEKMAKQSHKVQKFLAGNSVKKTVYVPGKIISFAV